MDASDPSATGDQLQRVRNYLLQQVESWRDAGVCQVPRLRVEPTTLPPVITSVQPVRETSKETPVPKMPSTTPIQGSPSLDLPGRIAALAVLQEEVRGCTRCAELASTRTQTVFGTGNPQARVCFFGEAPGADEDRQGEPFVGRAGQLLNKIIEACNWRREDVYILNVLKCRPPGNRTPTSEEADLCRPFFERQLQILQPEFICCLGAVAASALLGSKGPLGRLRGRFHDWRGIRVLVTYHPAYLLRNPDAKRDTWEDMQLLMREMKIAPP